MFVIQGSSRVNGNSEQLSKVMLAGLTAETVCLRDQKITPIVDQRHEPSGFAPVADDYDSLVDRMLKHEEIVFVTPLYWYGMSGLMKNFIDRWSQSLRVEGLDFKNKMQSKKMYVVIVGGSGARLKGLPLIQQFQLIVDFMGTTLAGYIIGEAAKPGDIMRDQLAIEQAKYRNKLLKG